MTTDSVQINNGLFFVPIGGSDQIGMNCTLYICDDQILIVDLGIGFAEDVPGVDVAVPDLSFVFAKKNKVVGIIITHVHEDHCGALSYLLKYLPQVSIYASNFAINFIKAKLDENHQNTNAIDFVCIKDTEEVNIKNFNVEFVNLTHSTVEMMALYIKTKHGTIFHTGDWKFDHDPVIGDPINLPRLKQIGESGVDVMVCDSTNVIVPGHSKSEGILYDNFYKIIKEADSRVLITLFASNVARISTILSVAKKLNKKVSLVGRAIWRVFHAAVASGYLEEFPGSMIINEVEIANCKQEDLIILCTGCQSEENAALTKIVNGKHRHVKLLRNDLIVFSSKNIPGNERKIYNTCNKIIRYGAKLITQSENNIVHVSGHCASEEIKEMYHLIKPRISIPVHGEDIHTAKHAQLAKDCGVEKVIVVHNGDFVKIDKDLSNVQKIAEVKSGFLYVDGKLFRRANDPVIKIRRKIMDDGLMVISIYVNKGEANSLNQIKVFSPGLLDETNDNSILTDFVNKLTKEISNLITGTNRKNDFYQTTMNFTKKFCKNRLGKDPLIKIDTILI